MFLSACVVARFFAGNDFTEKPQKLRYPMGILLIGSGSQNQVSTSFFFLYEKVQ